MNANDLEEFKNAMLQEVNAHTENDHWEVCKNFMQWPELASCWANRLDFFGSILS